MGIFKRVKQAIEIGLEVDQPSKASPSVPLAAGASTPEQLAALADESAGTRGRAVVQRTDGPRATEDHTQALVDRSTTEMVLELRMPDGSAGERRRFRPTLDRAAAYLAGHGTEVPVTLDPLTGAMVEVDTKALHAELKPRYAEAEQALKEADKGGLGLRHLGALVGDLKEQHAHSRQQPDPTVDLIEGVSADQWLLARKALGRNVPASVVARVAKAYGVPPGRWAEVNAAWSARAEGDPDLKKRLD